jgi:Flp pilus assembly protein TadG
LPEIEFLVKERDMRTSRRARRRRGAAVVEFAVVAPVVLFLIFAQIVGGLGIVRYQEVAHLARECARYASTHGGDYQWEGTATRTGVPAVASSSDLSSVVAREAASLDPSRITVDVSWTAASGITPRNIPTYTDPDPNLVPPGQIVVQNNVIVTVKYVWIPEAYLIGPITLSSTSEMPMSY